jgi:hypothetical protein
MAVLVGGDHAACVVADAAQQEVEKMQGESYRVLLAVECRFGLVPSYSNG